MTHVYLGLGSNLGDRRAMLQRAVAALRSVDGVRVRRASRVYESESWGLIGQPLYLNMVVEIETVLEPLELLCAVKALETRLGRRPAERWGPRLIDIDLILWEATVLDGPVVTLPHAAFRERAFVLVPLADIAPDAVDPVTGQTVAALAARLGNAGDQCRVAPLYS